MFYGLSIQVPSRTFTMQHAPNCFVTNCDKYLVWKLSSTVSSLHVYVEEEKWEVVSRKIIDGKRERMAIILHERSLGHRGAHRMCEADSDCTLHRNQKRLF